jgi:hypothetical protein
MFWNNCCVCQVFSNVYNLKRFMKTSFYKNKKEAVKLLRQPLFVVNYREMARYKQS